MEPTYPALSPESLLSNVGFVRRLARSLLRDGNAADDAAQETLLLALERPPRSEQGLRGWLAAVVRSVVRNGARTDARRSRRETRAAQAESTPSAAEILERESLRAMVVNAVLALSEPSRSAVLLRYYEDKTPREIARLQGVPVETVRTRIKRGLAELRGELDSRLGGERGGWARAVFPLATAGGRGWSLLPPVGAGVQVAAGFGALLVGAGGWTLVSGGSGSPLSGGEPGVPIQVASIAAARPEASDPPSIQEEGKKPNRVRIPPPSPASEREFSGFVRDSRGRPLASAILYVSPDGPPPEKFHYHPEWIAALQAKGIRFAFTETESDGRFREPFPDFERAYAVVVDAKDPYLVADPAAGTWVDLPAKDVAFQVADAPSAEVAATARVKETGEPLLAFACNLRRTSDGLVLASVRAESGTAVCRLPFRPTRTPDEFDLWIEDAKLGRASARVRLAPGERRQVDLLFPAPVSLAGQVVDPAGAPIKDALVFSGTQIRLRGDEPFKPSDPARVKDGVLTDAEGRFALSASERYVTVWHGHWSPKTVRREETAIVRLEPHATIRGRLLGRDGNPLAGAVVNLDRKRETVTDERGGFVFWCVEAGVRGLRLPTKRTVSVAVAPGETVEVDLGAEARLDVAVEVQRGGKAWLEGSGGVGVGTDRLSEVFEFKTRDGVLRLSDIRPGRYVVLAASGDLGTVDLTGPSATLEIGTTPLAVHAPPGTRVYLVPAGANELVELMAGRCASRTADASGVVEYSGLLRGRYGVGIDRLGVQAEVEIGDAPAVVRLD